MNIYRQIKCSDRLPDKNGRYLTDLGNKVYSIHTKNWHICDFTPEYWLEEIELPSEEEVIKEFTDYNGVIDTSGLFGVNFILNKIKQC